MGSACARERGRISLFNQFRCGQIVNNCLNKSLLWVALAPEHFSRLGSATLTFCYDDFQGCAHNNKVGLMIASQMENCNEPPSDTTIRPWIVAAPDRSGPPRSTKPSKIWMNNLTAR